MKKIGLIFAFCLCSICAFGQLIDNGPKLLITDDMKYEQLRNALDLISDSSEMCDILKKENPDIVKILQKWPPKFINDNTLSYKEKKARLRREYAPVIKYIKNFYSLPLKQLETKHPSKATYIGYCCKWHETALAQRGSANAQYALGTGLLDSFQGGTVEENIKWLQFAGAQGITDSYLVLGEACYNHKLYKKAVEWFKIGANAGNSNCMFRMGEFCIELRDAKTAMPWFEDAAKKEHYEAIRTCAEIYSNNYPPLIVCEKRPSVNYSLAIKYYLQLIEIEKRRNYAISKENIAFYNGIIKELQLKVED